MNSLFNYRYANTAVAGSLLLIMTILLISCKKDWLNAKPDKSLEVPRTISDFKALMSDPNFNDGSGQYFEHGTADFTVTDAGLASVSNQYERNFYSWVADAWGGGQEDGAWAYPYARILYANVVLEGIETIIPTSSFEANEWNQVKGSALFMRAFWHYDVACKFSVAYDRTTASTDLGIPLRLTSDFNEPSFRSTLDQTYGQIIKDLKEASEILPVSTPNSIIYKCSPTKSATYAMLARIYLSMSDYDNALLYADKTLQLYNFLFDFNSSGSTATPTTIAINANAPFLRFNNEVIFHMKGAHSSSFFTAAQLTVSPSFYNLYSSQDLRRTAYFRTVSGKITLKGTYDQSLTPFQGLATDEVYLIRAECQARKGNKDAALADLNTLMSRRYSSVTWSPITAGDANEALQKILIERRKELWFRNMRWLDLKRLNLESQFAVSLTKTINGQTYTLAPKSPLYVFPIPPGVIQLTGMPQNPR